MKCEECTSSPAEVLCLDCDQALCTPCRLRLHQRSKRKFHLVQSICSSCRRPGAFKQKLSQNILCRHCLSVPPNPLCSQLVKERRVTVYWDCPSYKSSIRAEIGPALQEISQKIGHPLSVRLYGSVPQSPEPIQGSALVLLGAFSTVSSPELLLMDMAAHCSSGVSDLLLISAQGHMLRDRLLGLRAIHAHLSIFLSVSACPLQLELVKYPVKAVLKHLSASQRSGHLEFRGVNAAEKAIGRKCLIIYLKELALKGEVMPEYSELVLKYSQKYNVSTKKAEEVVLDASEAGSVCVSQREMPAPHSHHYISLKLPKLGPESLFWVLRSLRNDEMAPTEKGVQLRAKEAFHVKLTEKQWQKLLLKISSSQEEFSLFARTSCFLFDIQSSECRLIFPRGEHWEALDNAKTDLLCTRDTALWDQFILFLREFFEGGAKAPKAIPGGRYGCAQFLKLFGPEALSSLPLGKLKYLVQLALNEDVLRYQRNFVIWSPDFSQESRRKDISKVRAVKNALIQLLTEKSEGISLAQLPQQLRNKVEFTFSISEFGFVKLKDFVESLPELMVKNAASNSPTALLRAHEHAG